MESKTYGIFFLAKKPMELFHRFHRFPMDKKHPASEVGLVVGIVLSSPQQSWSQKRLTKLMSHR